MAPAARACVSFSGDYYRRSSSFYRRFERRAEEEREGKGVELGLTGIALVFGLLNSLSSISFALGIDIWSVLAELARLAILSPEVILQRYYPVVVAMQVTLALLLNADLIYVSYITSKRTILSPTYVLTVNGAALFLSWFLFAIYRHPTFLLNFLTSAVAVFYASTYLPDIWRRYQERVARQRGEGGRAGGAGPSG